LRRHQIEGALRADNQGCTGQGGLCRAGKAGPAVVEDADDGA
jgi:hypothetical protein